MSHKCIHTPDCKVLKARLTTLPVRLSYCLAVTATVSRSTFSLCKFNVPKRDQDDPASSQNLVLQGNLHLVQWGNVLQASAVGMALADLYLQMLLQIFGCLILVPHIAQQKVGNHVRTVDWLSTIKNKLTGTPSLLACSAKLLCSPIKIIP